VCDLRSSIERARISAGSVFYPLRIASGVGFLSFHVFRTLLILYRAQVGVANRAFLLTSTHPIFTLTQSLRTVDLQSEQSAALPVGLFPVTQYPGSS
jgi:hypothetical protein